MPPSSLLPPIKVKPAVKAWRATSESARRVHSFSSQASDSAENWRAALQAVSGRPPIVALGKFDALHVGHSGMAEVLGWPARVPIVGESQRESILQSWSPLCAGLAPQYRALPFSSVRSMQPEEFVTLLAKDLKAHGVVVGKGYKFGYKQSGDAELLRRLGENMGMKIKVVDLVGVNIPGIEGHASSSEVRIALEQGKLKEVHNFLGRPYTLTAFLASLDFEDGLRIQKASFENQVPMPGEYKATFRLSRSGQELVNGSSNIRIAPNFIHVPGLKPMGGLGGSGLQLDLTFQV